jgi:penicillin-binding protein 1C
VKPFVPVLGVCLLLVAGSLLHVFSTPYPVLLLEAGGPLVITDRHGTVLRSIPSETGRPGRTSWVALKDVPGPVVATLLRSEDARFYHHAGVDPVGILRACWLNLSRGRLAFGGSTLTMQLVKMVHHSGQPRTLGRKLREAVLALRLERAVGKRVILEQYLNRAYYGNGAYGIDAAAERYFSKPAASLSIAEATLLTAIPRAPMAYDPLKHWTALRKRHLTLLSLLEQSQLLPAESIELARTGRLELRPRSVPFRAPHFVEWVLDEMPAAVKASGGVVRTSLDLRLQLQLERRVAEHLADMASSNLQQGGLVVLDTSSSEVLAMVGSVNGHQINITTRRRHPGSALKPFVYAAAIEAGDHPGTIAYDIHDVPSAYHNRQLTEREHGPVRYREALAGSFNLAAVHVLERVGIERVLSPLRRAGVGLLEGTADDYGLRLALGSPKVRLIDLAAGYGFLVRQGRVRPARGVIEVVLPGGARFVPESAAERQVFSAPTSWLVMDMLADPEARRAAFGYELPFDLPYPIAAKTGTSRGFADTVAIAATREFIVAAWAGNFDGSPTQGLVAMQAAAPLVRAGLLAVANGNSLTLPAKPPGIEAHSVCALSGMPAGATCPRQKRDAYDTLHPPHGPCTWHRLEADGTATLEYPEPVRRWRSQELSRAGVASADR